MSLSRQLVAPRTAAVIGPRKAEPTGPAFEERELWSLASFLNRSHERHFPPAVSTQRSSARFPEHCIRDQLEPDLYPIPNSPRTGRFREFDDFLDQCLARRVVGALGQDAWYYSP